MKLKHKVALITDGVMGLAKMVANRESNSAFNSSGKLMKNLLPLVFAVVLGVACFVPAQASAYYYRGRYYPYRYRGHYYQYSYGGHYYRYHYRGSYYRHRAWVVGVNGRAGYYRYW